MRQRDPDIFYFLFAICDLLLKPSARIINNK